jgi:hypothetical protein
MTMAVSDAYSKDERGGGGGRTTTTITNSAEATTTIIITSLTAGCVTLDCEQQHCP